MAPSTRRRVTKPVTGARRRWPSTTGTAAGTSFPAECSRPSACATTTAALARVATQMPLTQVTTSTSPQPTARSATPKIGTTLNGADSRRPTIAAANLLHLARQRTDTSRWWSMRWPSGAVSLVGRSLNLDTGKTYKLMRRLREHSITYLTKLWQLALDRAGKRDNAESRRRLQIDWAETKRRLGTHGRNAKRQLMPGWVVVAELPVYKIKHQLFGWKRVRMTAVLRGGQRTIKSFLPSAPPPCSVVVKGRLFLVVPPQGATTECALALFCSVLCGRTPLTSQAVFLTRDPGGVPEPLNPPVGI